MSHNLENNKILSAILIAGIVAMLAGFVAKKIIPEEHHMEKTAIAVDTSALESAQSGVAAPTGPEPILALLKDADVAKGAALAKACMACHGFEKGGPNKVGPNMFGIVNAKKAHIPDFAYSDVIKAMAAKGETWTYANLNHFLWKPAAYAPGTKMSYPGLKKPQDRANVIAYLRTLADSPEPLPTEAEIAAEAPKEEPAPAPDAAQTDTGADKAVTAEPTAATEAAPVTASDKAGVQATQPTSPTPAAQ